MIDHYDNIDPKKVNDAIRMLRLYITDFDIEPIISILEALDPKNNNDKLMEQLRIKLMALGPAQGAVLTYAPYIALVLADDPFDDFVTGA